MQSTVVNFEATYTEIAAASVPSNELRAIAQHLQTSILMYTGSAAQPSLAYIPTSGDPSLYEGAGSGRRHLLGSEPANPSSPWDSRFWSGRTQAGHLSHAPTHISSPAVCCIKRSEGSHWDEAACQRVSGDMAMQI